MTDGLPSLIGTVLPENKVDDTGLRVEASGQRIDHARELGKSESGDDLLNPSVVLGKAGKPDVACEVPVRNLSDTGQGLEKCRTLASKLPLELFEVD